MKKWATKQGQRSHKQSGNLKEFESKVKKIKTDHPTSLQNDNRNTFHLKMNIVFLWLKIWKRVLRTESEKASQPWWLRDYHFKRVHHLSKPSNWEANFKEAIYWRLCSSSCKNKVKVNPKMRNLVLNLLFFTFICDIVFKDGFLLKNVWWTVKLMQHNYSIHFLLF
jgi:hypothetical protein